MAGGRRISAVQHFGTIRCGINDRCGPAEEGITLGRFRRRKRDACVVGVIADAFHSSDTVGNAEGDNICAAKRRDTLGLGLAAAGAGISLDTVLRLGRLLRDGSGVPAMTQRLDRFLCRDHGAANGTMTAFGQTRRSTGRCHSGIRYGSVGDHVRIIVILRIAAKAAGVDGITLRGTGGCHNIAGDPVMRQHRKRRAAENRTAVVTSFGNGTRRCTGGVNGCGCGVRMRTGCADHGGVVGRTTGAALIDVERLVGTITAGIGTPAAGGIIAQNIAATGNCPSIAGKCKGPGGSTGAQRNLFCAGGIQVAAGAADNAAGDRPYIRICRLNAVTGIGSAGLDPVA